jgi:hypothetical protein
MTTELSFGLAGAKAAIGTERYRSHCAMKRSKRRTLPFVWVTLPM